MPRAEVSRESVVLNDSDEKYESLNSPKKNNSNKCLRIKLLSCFICTVFVSGAIYSSYLYYENNYDNSDNSGSGYI